MFTGIIEQMGKVVTFTDQTLCIEANFGDLRVGESISVSGVCLTLTGQKKGALSFDVGSETLRMTTLGALKPGDPVNLERALRVGDRLGGHWVTGHIEGTGRIAKVEDERTSRWFDVLIPKKATRYVILKGSIAIDGISLTVARLKGNQIRIMAIPHTLQNTTLSKKSKGDWVNLETDLLAKYALKSLPESARTLA